GLASLPPPESPPLGEARVSPLLAATSWPSDRDSAAAGFSPPPPETWKQFSAGVPRLCSATNTAGRSRSERSDRPTPAACVLLHLPAWVLKFPRSPRSSAEPDLL